MNLKNFVLSTITTTRGNLINSRQQLNPLHHPCICWQQNNAFTNVLKLACHLVSLYGSGIYIYTCFDKNEDWEMQTFGCTWVLFVTIQVSHVLFNTAWHNEEEKWNRYVYKIEFWAIQNGCLGQSFTSFPGIGSRNMYVCSANYHISNITVINHIDQWDGYMKDPWPNWIQLPCLDDRSTCHLCEEQHFSSERLAGQVAVEIFLYL